jgi:hypothetical protein
MPGADISTLGALLKDTYMGPVAEQLNNEVLLLQRLEARDQEIFGKQVITPIHIGRSGGIGARGESKQLPSPGNQRYDKAIYDLKYLYGRVRVTGPSMAKTRSEAGAFLQALKSELDGIRADLRKDVARQIYGDGDGKICTCASNAAGVVTLGARGAEAIRKGQLYIGMVVDIGTAADPDAVDAATTITAVNVATPSITVSPKSGTAVTGSHFVFRAGSVDGSTGVVYEIDNALGKLVSTTAGATVGGINSGTVTEWDNQRTASAALSFDSMQQAWNQLRIAGADPSLVIVSFGGQRIFKNLFDSKIQYTEPLTLRGGFKSLEFMGMPLVADVDAPFGRVYFLDEKFIKVFSNRDWHFLDEDGDVLKWRTDYDEWEAVLARYMNLGITGRRFQHVMEITGDTNGF